MIIKAQSTFHKTITIKASCLGKPCWNKACHLKSKTSQGFLPKLCDHFAPKLHSFPHLHITIWSHPSLGSELQVLFNSPGKQPYWMAYTSVFSPWPDWQKDKTPYPSCLCYWLLKTVNTPLHSKINVNIQRWDASTTHACPLFLALWPPLFHSTNTPVFNLVSQ